MASRPWAQAEEAGFGRDLRSGRHWAWDSGTWLRMGLTLAVGADGVWNSLSVRESQGPGLRGGGGQRHKALKSLKAEEGHSLHFGNSRRGVPVQGVWGNI